jgi:hypothetical protein
MNRIDNHEVVAATVHFGEAHGKSSVWFHARQP